jgi:endonuclease/exonuclease/phosphatase family metal-dependent hydrolase
MNSGRQIHYMIRLCRVFLVLLIVTPWMGSGAKDSEPDTFTLLVYNVENLFDVNGISIFEEYQQSPQSNPYPYNGRRFFTKIRNHAEVIRLFGEGKGPDIVAFEEFENDFTQDPDFDLEAELEHYKGRSVEQLLTGEMDETVAKLPVEFFLMKYLDEIGLSGYRFYQPKFDPTWFDRGIAHRSVFLSRFPVLSASQFRVDDARDIFEVTFDVQGHPFKVLNNHWKSGASSPKSEPIRVQNAGVLRAVLDQCLEDDPKADIVLVGDFNSHHNQTLRMGDRVEKTGMNDVLGSQSSEKALFEGVADLYNLWYELPQQQRGSEVWANEWGTLMQVLVTPGLYDREGIQYVDQSFGVHKVAGFNFDVTSGTPISWVNIGNGKGCSDHLPVYAVFRIEGSEPLPKVDINQLGDEHETRHIPIKVDNSLENREIDSNPESLATLKETDLAERIGDLFLIDTRMGENRGITLGGVCYTLYAPLSEVRKTLEAIEPGTSVRFVAELGVFRGQLQFLINDPTWIDPDLNLQDLYTTEQVTEYIRSFPFTRELKQWHIHHTWDPSYADFTGDNYAGLQRGMRSLHVDQNGWDDIGQHFTLFPDGMWMIGRSLDKDPASIRGWNQGALAVEMVGNFDIGHDEMTDLQKQAIYEMTHFVVRELHLNAVFHRDHPDAGKTCPGSGIDRVEFMREALGE